MACITMFAPTMFTPTMTVTTTQFMRSVCCEDVHSQPTEIRQTSRLRMSWVVVTDASGSRQIRICWTSAGDC